MICPSCVIGVLRVTHTYKAGERASTRTKVCPSCEQKYTEVILLQEANGRGQGAAAVAAQIKKGGRDAAVRQIR